MTIPATIPDQLAHEIGNLTHDGIPLVWTEYVDRDGDSWYLTDRVHNNDRVMVPNTYGMPLMLRSDVERSYGPLTPEHT